MEDLVIEVRDHYVAQFRDFVARQRETCTTGAPEVKFELPDDTSAFQRLVVVDFVRNYDVPESVVFEPESILTFGRIEGSIATTKLAIEALRWDAVSLRHDVSQIDAAIKGWFTKWFDPDEVRFDPSVELSDCIHAVYVEAGELHVDLGTAPAEAFWELLDCLADGNAAFVDVS